MSSILRLFSLIALLAPTTQDAQTMSAIRYHDFGPPDVLKLETVPRPVPAEGELLVKVHAAGVNPIDWKLRSSRSTRVQLPCTPGFDVSGVVDSTGAGVTTFKPGDEVFAMVDLRRGGCYAQYVIVKPTEAALKPAGATHTDAAGVPLVALTAWQALFDSARLDAGQTVLIHGGAGGVGSVAVQLAKAKGAKVIATASKENHDFLKSIGADQVIDYRTEKFDEIVKDADVVLDTVGGDTQTRSFAVLKKGGVLVSIVGRPDADLAKQAGVRAESILVHPDADQLAEIAKLIAAGKLKPVTTHVIPLKDAAKAHEQSETRHTRGKIVLEVVSPPAEKSEAEK